jgi:pyridinium-3,5-bisthiocarboxylic acid mononucleotide nickel chelatase
MTIDAIGLGAGTKEFPDHANILRLFVGNAQLPAGSDRIWVLETNLDDLPGEVVGYATTQLMSAGALDAFVTPIQMKKNRPGVMITVLCDEARIPELEAILFRETTTLGIRRYPVSRHKLKREAATVDTTYGPVKGKLGWLEGRPPTFSPEYEDCARVARDQNVALRDVYQAAHAGYAQARPSAAPAISTPAGHEHAHDHADHGHDHGHHHPHAHEHPTDSG